MKKYRKIEEKILKRIKNLKIVEYFENDDNKFGKMEFEKWNYWDVEEFKQEIF